MNKMKNTFLVILSVVVLVSGFINWSQHGTIQEKTQVNDSLKTDLTKTKSILKNKSRYADSVATMNKLLYSQKQLTEAMNFRDITTAELFDIGDAVRVKLDSSIAHVVDITIGGGKYKYYIEYEVQYGDRHKEKLTPELIEKP